MTSETGSKVTFKGDLGVNKLTLGDPDGNDLSSAKTSDISENLSKDESDAEADVKPESKLEGISLLSMNEVDALPSTLRYNNFDLFCTFISITTYLFDLSMDIVVAVYFYHLGVSHGIYHYWYFGLTVTFVLLPSLTMTGFSFRWYLMDAENAQLPPVPLWRWILRLAILMLQIAPIMRYLDSMKNGLLSRHHASLAKKYEEKGDHEKKVDNKRLCLKYYTLMVYEDADATLLRLFECFMESAPQLVLQIYILIKDPHTFADRSIVRDDEDLNTILQTTILAVSVVSSLVSLAWSLVVYHRSLRYTYPEKKNLNWSGSICQFLWHFSSITARVLALSLFASIYPIYIGPVCVAHWIVMTVWVMSQQTQACHTKCEEFLFCLVLGVIYIFSFFNAKEEQTRFKYLIYYTFCFIENTILITFWFVYASEDHWYYYPGIIGHYASFFAGIAFMVLYYSCCHPSEINTDISSFLFWTRASHQTEKKPELIDLREVTSGSGGELMRMVKNENSLSSPTLDDLDGKVKVKVNNGKKHQDLRRSASVPNEESSPGYHHSTRTFKYMQSQK